MSMRADSQLLTTVRPEGLAGTTSAAPTSTGPRRGPDLRPPQRIGGYRPCVEIGSGGMARVYLAKRETAMGGWSPVALKVIHAAIAEDPAFVDMFVDEATIAARIQHPNVCRVLDYSSSGGKHVLVLEYLAGKTLTSVLARMRDPDCASDPQTHACIIARIIADAAEGLHSAHELRGRDGRLLDVVHRDVSPGNIMVTWDGCVKVMDFGLVSCETQRHVTRTGLVKGKVCYVQPEALNGQKPDRRGDVWSLGVLLWELLTGRRLFHGETDLATLQEVLSKPIPRPTSINGALPRGLDPIVERALSRDPEDRYPTARALGHDLITFIATQGIAVGLADLAEFMTTLFPSGPACTRQLLDILDRAGLGDATVETEPTPLPSAGGTTGVDSLGQPPPAGWSWRSAAAAGALGLAVGASTVFFAGVQPQMPRAAEQVRAHTKGPVQPSSPPKVASPNLVPLVPDEVGNPPGVETATIDMAATDEAPGAGDLPSTLRLADTPYVLEVAGTKPPERAGIVLRLRHTQG